MRIKKYENASSLIETTWLTYDSIQSNRKGGKLIPRKFQFGGFNRPIAR